MEAVHEHCEVSEQSKSAVPLKIVKQLAEVTTDRYFTHSDKTSREEFNKLLKEALSGPSESMPQRPKVVLAGLRSKGLSYSEKESGGMNGSGSDTPAFYIPYPPRAEFRDPDIPSDPVGALGALMIRGMLVIDSEESRDKFEKWHEGLLERLEAPVAQIAMNGSGVVVDK